MIGPGARAFDAPLPGRGDASGDPILFVGVSVRAPVTSARRAGYACAAADCFGDLDLRAEVPEELLATAPPPFSAGGLLRAARALPGRAVVYGAPFENHPEAVARLSAEREVWGVPAGALARVRDPVRLAAALRARGVATPAVLAPGEARRADPRRRWLRKRRRGGGGMGVRWWRPGDPVRGDEVLQEYRDGTPGSAVALADGRRAAVLGLTRQLVGRTALGVGGFRYCGSILPFTAASGEADRLLALTGEAARALTHAFGLRGWFGFDFVASEGRLHVLEVNPRYTASMELVERGLGAPLFGLHVRALRGRLPGELPGAPPPGLPGPLPAGPPSPPPGASGALGKAILFARRPVVPEDTRAWLAAGYADVPPPGTAVPAGGPICTLLAEAPDPEACRRELERKARALRAALVPPPGRGGGMGPGAEAAGMSSGRRWPA